MRSKALCLGVSEPTKWLAAKSTAYALRHQLGKHAFVKKNNKIKIEKISMQKQSAISLRYTNEFFSRLMAIYYLKVASYR